MNFKRDSYKPPRPPPPKNKLGGLTGISYSKIKALEEEEDEDLTLFTGKFDKVVEKAQKQQQKLEAASERKRDPKLVRTGSATAMDSKLTKIHTGSKSFDDDNSSPTKKSIFEYKDIITGLKDKISDTKEKITDTISKKFEEFSGDSSSTPSPEDEWPLVGGDIVPEKASIVIAEPRFVKSSIVQDAVVSSRKDKVSSEKDLSFRKDKVSSEKDLSFRKDKVSSEKDLSFRKDKVSSEKDLSSGKDKEEEFLDCEDIEASGLQAKAADGDIEVIDEYFSLDPMEDFSASPGFSVSLRQRSKLKSLVKKNSKQTVSATVAMSTLMDASPIEESNSIVVNPNVNISEVQKTASEVDRDKQTSPGSGGMQTPKPAEKTVPTQKLVAFTVCVFAYLIIPLPSYISGLLMGVLLTSSAWLLYLWYHQPPKQQEQFKLTPLEELPPMEIPEMKDPIKDDGIYKGWLNELMEYNADDYHINQTHTVYVSLEASHLRLQRPKVNVPKRAIWDEVIAAPHFVHQRHFDLEGSRVFLMPPGLVKKRIWSKKYPICIALAQSGTKSSSISAPDLPRHATTPNSDTELEFEIIDGDKCDSGILYLFARTGREKEDWYKRFVCASVGKPLPNHLLDLKRALADATKHKRSSSDSSLKSKRKGSNDSSPSLSTMESPVTTPKDNLSLLEVDLVGFAHYMGRLMPSSVGSRVSSPTHGKKDDKEDATWSSVSGSLICDKQLFWVNALIGRIFWDFLLDKWWSEKVTEKLQRKLSKIHVPYFIEELKVTDIDMGSEIPGIRRAGKPYLDEKGFWVDLDIAYSGGFRMTIETKVNLMKLKKEPHQNIVQRPSDESIRSAITDSDEEDSAESSTDEEEDTMTAEESAASGGTASKKFLRYLDKITQSKYFQQATEYKYIKKAMEGVSNTPLVLTVEVKSLIGTMAINIPPPPTDRLWYGFRGNPRLWLSAKPKVGERELTFNYITEWIEKKLSLEFQRVFVMPNMDDLVIPILLPGLLPDAVLAPSPCSSSSAV